VRKPHGQQGEVAVFPLVENPGAVFTPKARLLVVLDGDRLSIEDVISVAAGADAASLDPQSIEKMLRSRAVVEPWRDHFVAVEEADADD